MTVRPRHEALSKILSSIENKRAIILLSTYLGTKKMDMNTIQGISIIANKLSPQELTIGNVRSTLNRFVEAGLLEREREKMMGTRQVSFHSLTDVGMAAIVHLGLVYWGFGKKNIDEMTLRDALRQPNPASVAEVIIRPGIEEIKACRTILRKYKTMKSFEKAKVADSIETDIIKPVLYDKNMIRLRIYEIMLEESFDAGIGYNLDELAKILGEKVTRAPLNALFPLVEPSGDPKDKTYCLSRTGRVGSIGYAMFIVALGLVWNTAPFFGTPNLGESSIRALTRNSYKIFQEVLREDS